MKANARYVHTNIVARDWQRLARFYEEVLGCLPITPERDLVGPWLESATGVPGAQIRGIHLRLPGHGEDGPTLEIFEYNHLKARPETATNRPGLAHLAFGVDDVGQALEAVLNAGGGAVGELVSVDVAGVGTIDFVYVTDPEGNIIELQCWTLTGE
jgi:catechol 2,3-dioxygenase-like lactoylglutathione lyase family enzyme